MDMKTNEPPEPRKRTLTIRPMHVVIGILCVLIFAFVLFRIVFLNRVRKKLDAIRAQGYPVTLEELDAWYPDAPAGMNAADAYADAFRVYFNGEYEADADSPGTVDSNLTDLKRINFLPVVGQGDLPALSEPIPADMLDDIAWYVEKSAEAIGFLHEGATMTECRYPVDMTANAGMLLPHLGEIREAARLLKLEAILAAEQGDSKRAAQAVISSLAAAHSLKEEPIFISCLVRIACDSIACGSLERVLSRVSLSEEQLVRLASALAGEEDLDAITRAMASERCQGIGHFRTSGSLALAGGGSSIGWKGLDLLYRASGVRELDLNAYLGIMNTYVEQSQQPLMELVAAEAHLMNRTIADLPKYYILTRMLTPALTAACYRSGQNIAKLRCAMTAVAVERYRLAQGTLPENLDALVPEFVESIPLDPFDGGPLRFKKQEKGYVIYSVGMNQTDDGGTDAKSEDPQEHSGQPLDLLFTVER